MFKYILVFLTSAWAAILANRGIAIFNDAVRPIFPEFRENRMTRFELAATTFGLSFGLVIGFGIPFSIMSPIILIHSIFLGTDIIGTFFPGKPIKEWYKDKESLIGVILSGLIGGIYGLFILMGLGGFVKLMKMLPVNIFDPLGNLGDPVIYAFAAFPALAIAFEYGFKNGLLSLAIITLVREIAAKLKLASPDGIALLIGMLILLIYAIRQKSDENSGAVSVLSLFGNRVQNIKNNIIYIGIMGALYGMGVNLYLLAEGPQSLLAMSKGLKTEALGITISRALSFIPLKGTTSLASGTFVTDGFGFVATAGLLAPNMIIAAVLGAIVIILEALSLVVFAKIFDKYPGIRNAADNIRDAMTKLLEVAIIVGSMMAANKMAPGMGYLVVAGLYLLNETAKRPLVRMAVGPIGAIIVGVIVNLLAIIK
ncbi:YhfT family protein [Thermoanaerobacter sp. RKWS2]|uniref:YhfT family protein n=1 Tax=Thermoanaerobacter sp. RKWS2 TaxID=2983842 RepID=UPI00224B0370|nr:YhfT family protein [Thermoanaerobacter sp. RKWS2]UZQ83221.1 YhfT family protein [Thermoanaerobacter sp. RKWS2]